MDVNESLNALNNAESETSLGAAVDEHFSFDNSTSLVTGGSLNVAESTTNKFSELISSNNLAHQENASNNHFANDQQQKANANETVYDSVQTSSNKKMKKNKVW